MNLGLKKIIAHTNEEKKNIRKRLGRGTLNTRAKVQGLTLTIVVDIGV